MKARYAITSFLCLLFTGCSSIIPSRFPITLVYETQVDGHMVSGKFATGKGVVLTARRVNAQK